MAAGGWSGYAWSLADFRRLSAARFPAAKLLDEFDFATRPSVNKPLVLQLVQGDYLKRRENVLLVGPSGTGKSHLATAFGMAACDAFRQQRKEGNLQDQAIP
ncbi:MAG: hypothetical protein DWH81_08485 [Planctomycetota bacterium]|nr:MAG: hypothetical protein DWH81_08485 [Planctomycetota bacterium]